MLIIFVPSVALSISLWLEVDLIFRTLLEFLQDEKEKYQIHLLSGSGMITSLAPADLR